jgi:hypothetical protein
MDKWREKSNTSSDSALSKFRLKRFELEQRRQKADRAEIIEKRRNFANENVTCF